MFRRAWHSPILTRSTLKVHHRLPRPRRRQRADDTVSSQIEDMALGEVTARTPREEEEAEESAIAHHHQGPHARVPWRTVRGHGR